MSDQYDGMDDFVKSLDLGYAVIRERMAKGGPGWQLARTALREADNKIAEARKGETK